MILCVKFMLAMVVEYLYNFSWSTISLYFVNLGRTTFEVKRNMGERRWEKWQLSVSILICDGDVLWCQLQAEGCSEESCVSRCSQRTTVAQYRQKQGEPVRERTQKTIKSKRVFRPSAFATECSDHQHSRQSVHTISTSQSVCTYSTLSQCSHLAFVLSVHI